MKNNTIIKLKYFKKISIALLLGFIFVINTIPISFARTDYYCVIADQCLTTMSPFAASANCRIDNSKAAIAALPDCSRSNERYISETSVLRCACTVDEDTIAPRKDCSKEDLAKKLPANTCIAPNKQVWNIEKCAYACSCDAPTGTPIVCGTDKTATWVPTLCRYECIGVLQKFEPGTKQGQGEITYKPKITIPCNTKIAGGVCPANWKTDIASYIVRLYQFGLMIAGLVALGAIIYGAVLYTLSAGNFTSKEEGKEWMKDAIYGLLLLFGAYLLLYTINPDLVKLTSPTVTTLDLDKMIPQAIYVPGGTDTVSALGENPGVSGIEGCEVSEGGGGGFLSVNVKTDESNLSSDPNAMKCITCLAGYTKKDGKCFPSASGVCASGFVDSDAKCCPTGQKAVSSGNNKTKCVAPCPTGYDYDTSASCAKCATDYVKFNNKCVKPISSIPCASGYSDGTTCIPVNLIPKTNLF